MLSIDRYMLIAVVTYSTYLFGSFASNISGLSILPVFALLIGLGFSLNRLKFNVSILFFTLLVCLVYTISYALSSRGDYASYKYSMFFVKFLPLFLIPSIVINRQEHFFKGIFYILLVFLAISMFHLAAYVVSPSIHDRLEFGVFNPIWIGRAVFELVLIAVIILEMKRSTCIILFLCALFVTYAAGSKGAIVSFAVAFLFWHVSQNPSGIVKIRRLLLPVLAISGLIYLIFQVSDVDSYLIQRFFMAVPDGSSDNIIEESRAIVWPTTLQLLVTQDTSTLLFGNGLGEFGTMYFGKATDFRFYPHNLLLEIVSEFGLVVFLMVTIYIGKLLYFSKSKFKFIFIYFLCNAMFSGDLLLNEFTFFYLGFLVADRNIKKGSDEEVIQIRYS